MASIPTFVVLVLFLGFLMPCQFNAQSPGASINAARLLDALLQDYAYRAFVHPRTGAIYTAEAPSNFSGISISVVRLRSGSLRSRGLKSFKEFDVAAGIIVTPYVVRLALVYQNLGNWSSVYYMIPGYTFLAPVVGVLAYSASNLSTANLPELDILASAKPISIKFANVTPVPTGQTASCVHFHLNGSYQIGDLLSGNICTVYTQGHFSIIVNSSALAPSPAPNQGPRGAKKKSSNVWKIVVGVVVGFVALILVGFLILWLFKYRRSRKMTHMVKRSEAGEVLTIQRIGDAQLPVATMVRTRPVLENEHAS